MPTINRLSAVDSLSGSDLIPVYSQENGDARKASLNLLSEFIQSQITASDDKRTQYAAPAASGFSVSIVGTGDNVWLILTPLAGYAAGTIVLPEVSTVLDKQELLVNTTQAVNALTITANGATVIGAPTALLAGDFFRLRFDAVLDTWYRVG